MTNESTPRVAIFDNYWAATLAFVRSLGRQGVPIRCYGAGAGRWSRYCGSHSRCPPLDDAAQFEPWLLARIRAGEISRIAPTTDLIAYYVSKFRAEFVPEVQCTIPPLAEMVRCLIKTRFAEVCAVSDHPTLATAAPDDPARALDAAVKLGFPLILKPKSHLLVGFSERGRLVRNASELALVYREYAVSPGNEALAAEYPELRWPLMQRYLPSARQRVYSVSGIKDGGGRVLAACVSYKRHQWPPDVGVSTVQIGCDNERILDAGLHVVNRILSRGLFELELLTEGDALYAIDLNPRAFGFIALDMARGHDLPWLWYRTTIDQNVVAPPADSSVIYDARHRMMEFLPRLLSASPFSFRKNVDPAPGEGHGLTTTRVSVSMLGDWSDPIPMLLGHLHLLRHPRSFARAQIAAGRAMRARPSGTESVS